MNQKIETILSILITIFYLVAIAVGFAGYGLSDASWGAGESFLCTMPGFVIIALRLVIINFLLVNYSCCHIEEVLLLDARRH